MSIRITQSMMYTDMVSRMQSSLSAYMESVEQGSTQKKINRPSDDPAGMYRMLTARDDNIVQIKQLQTNVDTAKGWLTLQDSVLSTQVTTVITRLKGLAEQASSGTYTAENRRQIAYEVREQFGTLINLANTEYENKHLFAGHRYSSTAFEEGFAMTSLNDDSFTDDTASDYEAPEDETDYVYTNSWTYQLIESGEYTLSGAADYTVAVRFNSSGKLVNGKTYEWSKDGGTTWNTGTIVSDVDPSSTNLRMDFNGLSLSFDASKTIYVKAYPDMGDEATIVYIRPTAVYQGDTDETPLEITTMGEVETEDSSKKKALSASGTFGKDVLIRIDSVDGGSSSALSLVPQEDNQTYSWSYSTDGGMNWVYSENNTRPGTNVDGGATTSSDYSLRLPIPGGYLDLNPTDLTEDSDTYSTITSLAVGSQILVHPARGNLNYEIMPGTYLSVNGVGKDIFGGLYENKPALADNSRNLFEVVGAFIGYLENNNQDGCQETLAALESAQSHILTESARIGGLENRLTVAADVLTSQKLDLTERLSYIEDIDLTELLTKLTQQQITYQTVLQSSSMIMNLGLANYI